MTLQDEQCVDTLLTWLLLVAYATNPSSNLGYGQICVGVGLIFGLFNSKFIFIFPTTNCEIIVS